MDEDTRLAYLAGVIDGEGCISIGRLSKGRTFRLQIQIGMSGKALPLLLTLQCWFGGKVGGPYQCKGSRQPKYILFWSSKDAVELLAKLHPFLILKASHAILAMRYWNVIGALKGKWGDDKITFGSRCAEEMSLLNKKGCD